MLPHEKELVERLKKGPAKAASNVKEDEEDKLDIEEEEEVALIEDPRHLVHAPVAAGEDADRVSLARRDLESPAAGAAAGDGRTRRASSPASRTSWT